MWVFGHLAGTAAFHEFADFDGGSVGEAGAVFGDFGGFVDVIDAEHEVSGDGFLGFGVWAIGDVAVGAGDDASVVFEGLATEAAAIRDDSVEPVHPIGHDVLDLFGREVLVPCVVAEEEEEVFLGCGFHLDGAGC